MEATENKNEKNFIVMVLILIALIIIIFLLVRKLGFIDHKPLIPTGNVDIFDIIFKKDCDNNCECNNNLNSKDCINCNNGNLNNKSSSNTNKNTNNHNIVSNKNQSEEKDGVEVFDKETEYFQDTQLRIFTNAAYYVVDNKIAPDSQNSYQFVIRNNNKSDIKYDLNLNEENKYNVNMKYRLKLNGIYVVGNDDKWLSYKELKQENIELAANTYDVYTLDWKWFESSNDTEVGTNINSNYKLELRITASGY